MSITAGKDAVIKFSQTSIQDLATKSATTTHLSSYNISNRVSTHAIEAIGASAVTRKIGHKDFTLTVDGYYDKTDTQVALFEKGEEIFFEMAPNGTTAGNLKVTGQGIVETMDIGAEATGVTTFTVTIVANGASTETAYA